jgi:hypothetical protein
MLEALALAQYAATVAIAAIILWYVVEYLPIPFHMKRATQLLIALVCVLAVLARVTGAAPPPPLPRPDLIPPNKPTPERPSIIR